MNIIESPKNFEEIELEIIKRKIEEGRKEFEIFLQSAANNEPPIGVGGNRLIHIRQINMNIETSLGKVQINVLCGQNKLTGKWETPFRNRFFRGEHSAMSPALEQKIVTTVCETGSFEKAATVSKAWGYNLTDDKAMSTIRKVGEACSLSKLTTYCDFAARQDDILIIMMDGWMARYRENLWGKPNAEHEERVAWHEVKSGVIFRLSEVAEVNKNRRLIITKHIVAMPAETSPVDFGRKMQDEAERMGMNRAKKVYVIMDGGVYLWGVFEDRFANIAVGQLDYYHASQHLHALAEALFPTKTQKDEKTKWLNRLLKNLKTWGPKTLMEAIAIAETKKIEEEERQKTFKRESSYFKDHENHMNYRSAKADGVPIGSGAMESQCAQNQNRFKRRGQFWSKRGFALFLEAYVWYSNNELKHLYRPAI